MISSARSFGLTTSTIDSESTAQAFSEPRYTGCIRNRLRGNKGQNWAAIAIHGQRQTKQRLHQRFTHRVAKKMMDKATVKKGSDSAGQDARGRWFNTLAIDDLEERLVLFAPSFRSRLGAGDNSAPGRSPFRERNQQSLYCTSGSGCP